MPPVLGSVAVPPQFGPPLPGNCRVLLGGAPSSWNRNGVVGTGVVVASGALPQFLAGLGVLRKVVRSAAVTMSLSLSKLLRASWGGFSGNGCVGEYHSPGTSPLGTGRSSTPNTGLPVVRSRMNISAGLPIAASAGMVLPSFLISTRPAPGGRSESHRL